MNSDIKLTGYFPVIITASVIGTHNGIEPFVVFRLVKVLGHIYYNVIFSVNSILETRSAGINWNSTGKREENSIPS